MVKRVSVILLEFGLSSNRRAGGVVIPVLCDVELGRSLTGESKSNSNCTSSALLVSVFFIAFSSDC